MLYNFQAFERPREKKGKVAGRHFQINKFMETAIGVWWRLSVCACVGGGLVEKCQRGESSRARGKL